MKQDKRTKEELLKYINSLEKENDRLTNERNTATNALENWKRANQLTSLDDLDDTTIKCIKLIMKMSDKVRSRF
jgi:uncharacterized protein YlxW (UPF0749 family)